MINLYINIGCNYDQCMFNHAVFRDTETNEEVILDRDGTFYRDAKDNDDDLYKYKIETEWMNCYIWNGGYKQYDFNHKNLEFIRLGIIDEAPEDYTISVNNVDFFNVLFVDYKE